MNRCLGVAIAFGLLGCTAPSSGSAGDGIGERALRLCSSISLEIGRRVKKGPLDGSSSAQVDKEFYSTIEPTRADRLKIVCLRTIAAGGDVKNVDEMLATHFPDRGQLVADLAAGENRLDELGWRHAKLFDEMFSKQ